MAVAFVKNHTVAFNKTAGGTTLALALDTAVPAGNLIVCRMVYDNAATASKPLLSSITRAAGETNTWATPVHALSTNTTLGSFASGGMTWIYTSVSWPAGSYTVTLDTATTQKAGAFQEFSGTLATLSQSGTAYSTTTTAATAVTATVGVSADAGDLGLGFIFGSNVAAVQAGSTSTSNGTWTGNTGIGSTGSSAATNNFGVAQYKLVTGQGNHSLGNSAAMTAGNGAIAVTLKPYVPPAITQASYRWFDEGTEAGAVALAAQDTLATGDVSVNDGIGQLRVRLQSTNAIAPGATDDWQLQWEKTAGTATIADSYPDTNRSSGAATQALDGGQGQSFLGTGAPLVRAGFLLQKTGAPTGNVRAYLYAHTGTFGTGAGTGSPLTTSTTSVSCASLATSYAWVYFDFDGTYTPTNGIPYVICWRIDTGLSGGNRVDAGTDNTTPTHPGNHAAFNGSSWVPDASDAIFEVYTKPVTTGNVLPSGSDVLSVSNGTGASTWAVGTNTGGQGVAQSFLGAGAVSRIGFNIKRTGTIAGNITYAIYAHSGTFGASGSTPTGTALATSTTVTDAATLSTTAAMVYATFSPPFAATPGTHYFVAIQGTNLGTGQVDVTYSGSDVSPGAFSVRNSVGAWVAGSGDAVYEIYLAGTTAVAYASANLTDGAATTNRLTGGTGSFVAGKVSETGVVTDLGWAANNYTEVLYSLALQKSTLAHGDVLRFKVLRNGATTDLTYTQIPTITVTKTEPTITQAAYRWYDDDDPAPSVLTEGYAEANHTAGQALTTTSVSLGQSFLGNGQRLTRVGWRLTRAPVPTGTFTARLYAHSGTFGASNSIPTGTALADSTTTLTASSITTSYAWYYFDFSGAYTLEAGTPYFVTLESSGATTTVSASSNSTAPTHPGCKAIYSTTSGLWTNPISVDMVFEVYTKLSSEVASTALAAQDTPAAGDVSIADGIGQLRVLLQSTNFAPIDATDDWQLQWEKNTSGTWNNVTPAGGLFDSYADTNSETLGALSAANSCRGQTFLGNGLKLSRCGFFMSKAGTPTGTLTAYLYAHTGTFGGGGSDTGSVLATSTTTVAATSLGTTNAWVYFDFDGTFTMTNGTPYCIMVATDIAVDISNCARAGFDSTSPTHAGNLVSGTRGSTVGDATRDLVFAVYAAGGTTAVAYNSANLTDGAATTNRLTGGSGTFTPGKVSETGLVSNVGWAGNNYTELVYSLDIVNTDVVNGDTLRFRVLRNGAATGLTYTQVPTLNVVKTAPVGGKIKWWNGSAWVEKPVKWWNGSAWVEKPLKVWSGSAWVLS